MPAKKKVMEIRSPQTKKELEAYYDLRYRVLREPWGQPRGSEKDDIEDRSIHVIAIEDGKIIGCGRLHFNSKKEAQIRQMAVEEAYRGTGVGKSIVLELERVAKEKGAKYVVTDAREVALGFYEKLGYMVCGNAPTIFGSVKQCKMRKDLN
jgi:N-acetylglutamate synthase-like GNAT family acetyltransferase